MLDMPHQHLLCVGPADLPKVWPLVADMIDAAYAEIDDVTPDVLTWLTEGKGFLWVLSDGSKFIGAATTSLVKARSGLALRLVSCGGRQCDWEGCMREIESYAWAEGCYKVIFDGRRGWGKVLADYRPIYVSFEKRK